MTQFLGKQSGTALDTISEDTNHSLKFDDINNLRDDALITICYDADNINLDNIDGGDSDGVTVVYVGSGHDHDDNKPSIDPLTLDKYEYFWFV